jgi:hypothetical protein
VSVSHQSPFGKANLKLETFIRLEIIEIKHILAAQFVHRDHIHQLAIEIWKILPNPFLQKQSLVLILTLELKEITECRVAKRWVVLVDVHNKLI